MIVSNLEQERAIYESFKMELMDLPSPTFSSTNKAVLGRLVKRIHSQDIFESGELYTTELRSPGDNEETQPLVAFLQNLQDLADNTVLSGNGKMDKPITATGPRQVRHGMASFENYDRLQLRPASMMGTQTTLERCPPAPPLHARPSPNYKNRMLNKSMPNPFQKDSI